MSDIIREIQDELKQEKMNRLVLVYGKYIIAAILGVVIILTLFTMWQDRKKQTLEADTAKLYNALNAETISKADEILIELINGTKLNKMATFLQLDFKIAEHKADCIEKLHKLSSDHHYLIKDLALLKLSFLDPKAEIPKKHYHTIKVFNNIIKFNQAVASDTIDYNQLATIIATPSVSMELRRFAMQIQSLQ